MPLVPIKRDFPIFATGTPVYHVTPNFPFKLFPDQLMHFSHDHPLNIVRLQPNHNNESFNEEEEYDDDDGDFIIEDHLSDKCNMCNEHIYPFHLHYLSCKYCGYSLHKFCAEMPKTLQNHPLHPSHDLTLFDVFERFHIPDNRCGICNDVKGENCFIYHCSICKFNIDMICATMSQQKMKHPSHPHQLNRMSKHLTSYCNACGKIHVGTFYYCSICPWFWINLDCALLPTKSLIQRPTNDTVTHSHPLTLAFSFPQIYTKAMFNPKCRICDRGFYSYLWLYKCDKCRYYVHCDCVASKTHHSKSSKNFIEEDHPHLLHCPVPDESYIIKLIVKDNHDEMLNHFSHEHPLILLDTQTSLDNNSVFLHNPMKKVQLLCDGCVKPITETPFYKCSQDVEHCGFVLHEWCARLPLELQHHPGHPKHTLVLLPKLPSKFVMVFHCYICWLPSNGFAYGCKICNYYIDINCAFLPSEITHEAHPDHLLSLVNSSGNLSRTRCDACHHSLEYCMAFHCSSCNFYLDAKCALLLPRSIRHKYDKHPLCIRYSPAENHPGDYFCEVCEDEFDPEDWFYHCSVCKQSMHPSCAPLILACEQVVYAKYHRFVFQFLNVKFGRMVEIQGHPHRLAFVQGIEFHGDCKMCERKLQFQMIFKCLECEYALHLDCVISYDIDTSHWCTPFV